MRRDQTRTAQGELEEARRYVDVVSVQNRYNLTDRGHEAVVDYCTAEGIAFIPWVPIARGEHAMSQLLGIVLTEDQQARLAALSPVG